MKNSNEIEISQHLKNLDAYGYTQISGYLAPDVKNKARELMLNNYSEVTNVELNGRPARDKLNNPEAAMYVYKFKKEQWSNFNIPSYIVTHYKINIDG